MTDHLRHHRGHEHLHRPYGGDVFGRASEAIANFLGTPAFLIGQTIATALWIAMNTVAIFRPFDPFPYILLNLAYSIQAGFAGPFVLCAQTRQAQRDKAISEADAKHREELATHTHEILEELRRTLTEGESHDQR